MVVNGYGIVDVIKWGQYWWWSDIMRTEYEDNIVGVGKLGQCQKIFLNMDKFEA